MPPIYPEDLILLEPVNLPAEDILPGTSNPAAVYRYLDCLERGWIGQALRERYSFGKTENTPPGMIETNSIGADGRFIEWLKPIDDEIKDDLRGSIEGNETSISITRDTFVKGLEKTDDPGLDLLKELVEIMIVGLKNMPKIQITILGLQGTMIRPAFYMPWHDGLEDALTRLSAKILDEAVLDLSFKKSGRDMHVEFRIDDRENDAVGSALVEEFI